MTKRRYYSLRTGKNPNGSNIPLPMLASLLYTAFRDLSTEGYFQEFFGYWCVDAGDVAGKLGEDIKGKLLLALRKEIIWPFPDRFAGLDEADIFDILEYLHDHVSKPTHGFHHTFSNCGWHYDVFDSNVGRTEFRNQVNPLLESYKTGYELSESGEILEIPDPGMESLLKANLPSPDERVTKTIESAIEKFRRYRSSIDDRRDAIRDLAGVLEYLRPKVKEVLISQDENDLFNIANNFAIRHHNQKQKSEYDPSIWLSWMFYFYLATIHAVVRMTSKERRNTP